MTRPCLPQDASNPRRRRAEIQAAHTLYQYEYDTLPPVPMTKKMPEKEAFSFRFQLGFLEIGKNLLINHLRVIRQYFDEGVLNLDLLSLPVVLQKTLNESGAMLQRTIIADLVGRKPIRADSLKDFADLYKKLPKPDMLPDWQSDDFFAYQRLAGYNPNIIQGISKVPDRFPVDDAMFQAITGSGKTLQEAGAEGRLYLCDYAILDGIDLGTASGLQKYLTAPLALFYRADTAPGQCPLMPVAIQLGQTPDAEKNPIFTPKDGMKWQLAKLYVSSADGNHHETIAHFADCHMTVEPMVIASHRTLSCDHPILVLLKPHFRFNIAINEHARGDLIVKDGVVDTLLGGTLQGSFELMRRSYQDWRLVDQIPERRFTARHMADRELLPDYPFRDDTTALWQAIHGFVGDYIDLYYRSDADVLADSELRAWALEMSAQDGARVKGLPVDDDGFITNRDDLKLILTHIIYIAGPQHSSVNYAQFPYMSYPPYCPLALYGPPPTAASSEDEASFLARMPPITIALYQNEFTYLLSSRYYDRLGHYPDDDFVDERVDPLLKAFQAKLAEIEGQIDHANDTHRFRPYELQLPSRVTNSISI